MNYKPAYNLHWPDEHSQYPINCFRDLLTFSARQFVYDSSYWKKDTPGQCYLLSKNEEWKTNHCTLLPQRDFIRNYSSLIYMINSTLLWLIRRCLKALAGTQKEMFFRDSSILGNLPKNKKLQFFFQIQNNALIFFMFSSWCDQKDGRMSKGDEFVVILPFNFLSFSAVQVINFSWILNI